MRRKINVISILCILLVLYLSGCISNNGGGGQALDSDGDGYPDNIDDFPNDSNLHKKDIIADVNHLLLHETTQRDKGWESYISSDYKYVDVSISFSGSASALKYCQVYIMQPNGEYDNVYGQSTFIKRYIISTSNSGTWYFNIYNTGYEQLYVDCYIVKVM